MPTYRITAPNGVTYQTEGPPGATPEEVKAVILRAHPEAAQKPPEEKGETSLPRDLAGTLIQGVGDLSTAAGGLYGTLTGDFDNAAKRLGSRIEKYGESVKTPAQVALERESATRVAEAEKTGGFMSGVGAQLGEFYDNPRLLASGIVRTLPQLVGTGGAGAVGAKAASVVGKRAAARAATEEAAKAALKKSVTRGAKVGVGVGSGALVGGDAGATVYENIMQLPDEVLEQSEVYQQFLEEGVDPATARRAVALRQARIAAIPAAVVSGVTAGLSGIESQLLTGGVAGTGLRKVGGAALREGAQETVEEGSQGIAENLATGDIDPSVRPLDNIGSRATTGGVLGVLTGGGTAALSRGEKPVEINTEADTRKPLESLDIVVPNPDDPAIGVKERLDILSRPDADGNVTVRRADGKLANMSLEMLEKFRLSTGQFNPSDMFGYDMVSGRLQSAAGEKPDSTTTSILKALNLKLNNDIALGRPDEADKYVREIEAGRFTRQKKLQAQREFTKEGLSGIKEPGLRVLFEAKSIINDYRVEYAKQQAQPGATVGDITPPSNTTTLAQILERNQQAREEGSVIRKELFDNIIASPNVADKRGAFASALEAQGLDAPTNEEMSTLLDRMREESEDETSTLGEQGQRAKQVANVRSRIIDTVGPQALDRIDKRISDIEGELMRAGLDPLTESETNRLFKVARSKDAFANEGQGATEEATIAEPPAGPAPLDATVAGVTEEADEVSGEDPATTPVITPAPAGAVDRQAAFAEANNRYPGNDALATAFYNGATGQPLDTYARFNASEEELAAYRAGQELVSGAQPAAAPSGPTPPPVDETAPEPVEAAPTKKTRAKKAAPEPEPVVAAVEEPTGPKVTVLPAGVAQGVKPKPRPMLNTQLGRPVEGAAELTPFMLAQQALNERLRVIRNNNLISDKDVAAILNLLRVPTSDADMAALRPSLREKWNEVFRLNEIMEGVAGEVASLENAPEGETVRAKAKRVKALKTAEERLKTLQKQGDDALIGTVRFAEGELKLRTANRQSKLRQIEADFKAGKIDKRERDIRLNELRVDTPMAPRMAESGISGVRTEAAKRFVEAAKQSESADGVLTAIIKEGGVLGKMAERLLAIAPNVRVRVVSPDTLNAIAERYTGRAPVSGTEGMWVPALDTVYLSSDMELDHTPVHEISHAILAGHIERNTDEGQQISAIFQTFHELATDEQRAEYGLKDAHEFAAEVWGNEQFRQLIRDMTPAPTKAEPKPRNLLQRMADAIARIFRKEVGPRADAAPAVDYVEQVLQATERAAKQAVKGTQARAIERNLRENPNEPRAGTVGILASLQQTFKSLAKSQSTLARKLNRGFFNRYQDAIDYDKMLAFMYGVDRLPENMSLFFKAERFESKRSGRQLTLDRDYIQPLIKKIADLDLDLQDVGMYLWARSAKDRNAMIKTRNSAFPEAGSGMSDAEAEAILKDFALKGLEPKLKQIAKMHDTLVDYMLNQQVKEGLLTRKQAKAVRDAQPLYTPLKGFALEGDMQVMGDESPHSDEAYIRNLGIRRTEYTKSGGRVSMPFNPLLMLMTDAKRLVQRVEVNQVGKRLLDNILNDPEAHKGIAAYYTDSDAKVRHEISDNPAYPDGYTVPINMRMQRGKFLVVKKDGVPYYIEFADTEAGQALKRAFDNMAPRQLAGFLRTATVTANKLKSMLTRYSPPYLSRALARDLMDAVANAYSAQTDKASPAFGKKLAAKVSAYISPTSKTGRLIDKTIINYVRGNEPKNDAEAEMMLVMEQMIEDGGTPGHAVIQDLELLTADAEAQLKRLQKLKAKDPVQFAKEVPTAMLGALDAASQMIDYKARLATYVAAMEVGISQEGAASLALNSSLNLTRRGEWAQYLDVMFFFFSPAAESARRFKRMALNSSNGRKIIAGQMAMGATLMLWNMMMGSGDDDDDGRPNFMDIPDATKQTSLVIMTGPKNDDYVAIPLGFMLGFPTYVGQKMSEAAYGLVSPEEASISMGDAALSIAASAVTIFSPVRPQGAEAQQIATSLVPNIAKPFADLIVNRNYFDNPIYTESFSNDRAASTLGREETGRVWKWMARSLNEATGGEGSVAGGIDLQPEAYRYLFEAYAGGLYRTAEDTVALITEDNDEDKTLAQRLPIVRAYVGKGGEYVPMNEYFKNTDTAYGAPMIATQPNLSQLVRMEKYEPEDFEAIMEKYPLRTDQFVMDAYKDAKSKLDKIGRNRREELLGVDNPEDRRDIVKAYREEQNEVYKEFNRTYNDIKAEYRDE
jgi:hypothetical protein